MQEQAEAVQEHAEDVHKYDGQIIQFTPRLVVFVNPLCRFLHRLCVSLLRLFVFYALRWRPIPALGDLFKSIWQPVLSKGIVKKNFISIFCIF